MTAMNREVTRACRCGQTVVFVYDDDGRARPFEPSPSGGASDIPHTCPSPPRAIGKK